MIIFDIDQCKENEIVSVKDLYKNYAPLYIPSKDIDVEEKMIFVLPEVEEVYYYKGYPRPRFYNNHCRFHNKPKMRKYRLNP